MRGATVCAIAVSLLLLQTQIALPVPNVRKQSMAQTVLHVCRAQPGTLSGRTRAGANLVRTERLASTASHVRSVHLAPRCPQIWRRRSACRVCFQAWDMRVWTELSVLFARMAASQTRPDLNAPFVHHGMLALMVTVSNARLGKSRGMRWDPLSVSPAPHKAVFTMASAFNAWMEQSQMQRLPLSAYLVQMV